MQNEFAFFPGCVLSQAAKEAKMSLEAIAPVLGWKLHEIKGWSCCGAQQAQDVDPIAALVANARNGTSEVTSLLWELYQNVDTLKAKVVKPLSGLKVALFYGCHSLRPEKDLHNRESSVNPKSFETVVSALGATIVPFEKRLDCCGFHASYPAGKSVRKMSSQIVNNADQNGADVVVTPCPLCQMQLDIYQERYQDENHSDVRKPIIHLSQLVGLALGLSVEDLGLDLNIIDASKIA